MSTLVECGSICTYNFLEKSEIKSSRRLRMVKCMAIEKWSKGDAPGDYGGPPVDPRIRTSWGGGKKEDIITSKESYLWNVDWRKTMELERLEDELLEPSKDETKDDKRSGFLSLGRSMALDRVDVDLSAELSRPSKATLERQVAQVRQLSRKMGKEEESGEKIRWVSVPMKGDEKDWAKANKYTTGGSAKLMADVKADVGKKDPARQREEDLLKFLKLKSDLQLYTLGIGSSAVASAYFTYSPEIAFSYGVGLIGSIIYIRMLSSSVEGLGANSAAGAAKGAIGQPRILVPVVLVMAFNRWNTLVVPQYEVMPLELIPMLVGFFTYKAATLVQTFKEVLEPITPKQNT